MHLSLPYFSAVWICCIRGLKEIGLPSHLCPFLVGVNGYGVKPFVGSQGLVHLWSITPYPKEFKSDKVHVSPQSISRPYTTHLVRWILYLWTFSNTNNNELRIENFIFVFILIFLKFYNFNQTEFKPDGLHHTYNNQKSDKNKFRSSSAKLGFNMLRMHVSVGDYFISCLIFHENNFC